MSVAIYTDQGRYSNRNRNCYHRYSGIALVSGPGSDRSS